MKTKNILLLAAFATTFILSGCKQEVPFDTQSPDDAPLILKPYNESGTGSFSYDLANPDTPLFDSVTVTPSRYTTVKWYLDGKEVFTGVKINMCFPAGSYALSIVATTEAGKSTHREGSVTVHPYATDPYSAAPAGGRHCAPSMTVTLSGANLAAVTKVIVSEDLFGEDKVAAIDPAAKDDASLSFVVPEMANGKYYLRLQNAAGNLFGADAMEVHNEAVVLEGYEVFTPGQEWVITGVNLQSVKSVKVGSETITDLTVTETTVTFIAPNLAEGKYTMSMLNADGSSVLFITSEGAVKEVTTMVSAETVIWEGPVALDWNADLVNISAATMAAVPVGSTILVYFEIPEAEYHNLRITTPWWGDDLVAQFDVTGDTPNPFTFIYDDRCKGIVDQVGSWSIVGFGETINKISFK